MSKNHNVKERFYAKGYYAGLPPEPRFAIVAEIFSQLEGDRLLDIGCGDGDISLLLRERVQAKQVFGIDISHEAVSVAQGKGIEARQLDIDEGDLPFEDDYFDLIYCGELIEHVFDPDHLLKEIHRVLKAEGLCVLTTPNLAGWPSRFALLLGYLPYPMAASPSHEGVGKLLLRGSEGQWGHIRTMTLRALQELVRLHHFKVKRLMGSPVTINSRIPRLFLTLIRLADKVMSRFPSLSTRTIAILKKE